MMDWYTIEFLYYKSYVRFVNSMFPNTGILSISSLEFYDIKKLYKFFDDEGIIMNVESFNPHQWGYSISLSNGITFGLCHETKQTREEIEVEGFYDCFKILDKQLRTIY